MIWTRDLAEKLLNYYNDGHSWVEISRDVGLEPQSVARLARGMHASVGDEAGQRIMAMLGLEEQPAAEYKARSLISVTSSMEDMEPTIRKGQEVYCEPVGLSGARDGALVYVEARAMIDGSWQDISTIGYLTRRGQAYMLSQERYRDEADIKLNPRDIKTVAAVVLPTSRHFAVDIRR